MIYFSDFGGAPLTTSYSNPGGSGARADVTVFISVTNLSFRLGLQASILDGDYNNDTWITGNPSLNGTQTINFDFVTAKVIDEFKWYQDVSAAQGTWIFEGSADNSSWTGLGSSFTLNNGTFPITNSTAYRYYRLRGLSGSATDVPYTREIEFKIST